ncbi:MAG: hypothetical protein WBN97_00275 [Parvibaculum sp.]
MVRFGAGLIVGFLLCSWALDTLPQEALLNAWHMLNENWSH